MAQKIGLLGLGLVGRVIHELVTPHGYECFAVRRPSTEDFPDIGGTLVDTPRELAEVSDILVSALPTPESQVDAFYGDDGVLAGCHEGLTILEMNTFHVADKMELKEAVEKTPAKILDTPLSGTPPMLRSGVGVIMTSGDEALCEAVRPFLELVAPNVNYVGEFGNGIKFKIVINFLVGANTVSVAEGMLLGHSLGLTNEELIDVVGKSAAGSVVFNFRAPVIAERKWHPNAGPAKLLWKDLDIVEDEADLHGLPAPVLRAANVLYKKVAAAGRLEDEVSVVYEIMEAEQKALKG